MLSMANAASQAEAFSREYAVSTFDGQGDNLMSITELLDQGSMVSGHASQLDEKYARRMQLLDTRKRLRKTLQEVTSTASDLRAQLLSINNTINPVKEAINILSDTIKDSQQVITDCEAKKLELENVYISKCEEYDGLIATSAQLRESNEAMKKQLEELLETSECSDAENLEARGGSIASALRNNDPSISTKYGIARRHQALEPDHMLRTRVVHCSGSRCLEAGYRRQAEDIQHSRQNAERLEASAVELRGLITQLSSVLAQPSSTMYGPPGSQVYLVAPCRHLIVTIGNPLVPQRDRCPRCYVRVTDILKVEQYRSTV
ncbi:Protein 21.1 [Giardia duodenalis assemblage B]|uniref:Protein 21.1 n=1 Tax=Giardia duodenalis assemblage B TaxID=1394984 RepID=A0A132NTA2_GIAIN|nr:Protein 21.1 [Giardia intestinalis assemblage B]